MLWLKCQYRITTWINQLIYLMYFELTVKLIRLEKFSSLCKT